MPSFTHFELHLLIVSSISARMVGITIVEAEFLENKQIVGRAKWHHWLKNYAKFPVYKAVMSS